MVLPQSRPVVADHSLTSWLARLQSAHPAEIVLGLERVAAVWAVLQGQLRGDPNKPFGAAPVVAVAGTNGKGSTVAALEALARGHGLRVGCYSSPHLLRFNERVRIDGSDIDDGALVAALEQVERARGAIALTFFEHTTLAALVIFAGQALDLVVLEVGLGGRLDAVNIVDADLSIVTSIDLDHQAFLGTTRAAIAVEKLGIARANRPLVIGECDHPDGFIAAVAATEARPLWLGNDFFCEPQGAGGWRYRDSDLALAPLERGPLLPENLALAIAAYRQLRLPFEAGIAAQSLRQLRVAGRQQRLYYRGRELLLDVAHNPASCRQLAASLTAAGQPAVAVASAFADKDFAAMAAPLLPLIGQWWLGPIRDNPRAADAHKLAQLLYNDDARATVCESLPAALQQAIVESPSDCLIVVLGSFMVVAEVLSVVAEESA